MMPYVPSELMISVLGAIDSCPKYQINTMSLEDYNIAVQTDRGEQGYLVNDQLLDNYIPKVTLPQIVDRASQAVRIRIQLERNDLEIFPSVSSEKAGFARGYIEYVLQENIDLQEADYLFFGAIASTLWEYEKVLSFPLIKKIAPLDASEIIQLVQPILAGS